MAIERISPDHPLWANFCAHLTRHDMARWVLKPNLPGTDTSCQPLPALYFLATVECDNVIGHIALKMQHIALPTANNEPPSSPLMTRDQCPIRELFVQTFAVDDKFRNQGRGRMLQLAALDLCRRLGCYQLRSWSSADKLANYTLKLSLGFAIHPAIQETPDGQQISGVYFVRTVTNF